MAKLITCSESGHSNLPLQCRVREWSLLPLCCFGLSTTTPRLSWLSSGSHPSWMANRLDPT